MKVEEFLGIIKDNKDDKQTHYKLGKIDPAYKAGRPRIIFDGEVTPSNKQYSHLSSYTPKGSDRVLLLRVAGTYVILGQVI